MPFANAISYTYAGFVRAKTAWGWSLVLTKHTVAAKTPWTSSIPTR